MTCDSVSIRWIHTEERIVSVTGSSMAAVSSRLQSSVQTSGRKEGTVIS